MDLQKSVLLIGLLILSSGICSAVTTSDIKPASTIKSGAPVQDLGKQEELVEWFVQNASSHVPAESIPTFTQEVRELIRTMYGTGCMAASSANLALREVQQKLATYIADKRKKLALHTSLVSAPVEESVSPTIWQRVTELGAKRSVQVVVVGIVATVAGVIVYNKMQNKDDREFE